eukprot:10672668-Lingulodinium_polyedra.AAC.1
MLRHAAAVVAGGIVLGSIYLLHGEGVGPTSWRILCQLCEALVQLGMPFVIAGDYNMGPNELEETG